MIPMGSGIWLIIMILTTNHNGISTAIEKVPMKTMEQCHAMGQNLKDITFEIKYFCLEGSKV